jgi:hypothetical protein
MSTRQQQRKFENHRVPLRRVVATNEAYVCGICRGKYNEIHQAEHCLDICTQEFLAELPIETVRVFGVHKFRCRFCGRDFADHPSALDCAKDCRDRFLERSTEVPATGQFVAKKRNRYVSRPKPTKFKTIAPYRLRNMISQDDIDKEVADAENGGLNSGGGTGADGQNKTQEKMFRRKSDLKDKFIRQGAEYQCTYCIKMYYTKVEVLACFDAHPEEEEIDPNAVAPAPAPAQKAKK